MQGMGFFIATAVVTVVATILVIIWYVRIASKPCVNPEGGLNMLNNTFFERHQPWLRLPRSHATPST